MIAIGDIYDKDISFLVGSGASVGLLPTLELGLSKAGGGKWSLEELATHFENAQDDRYVPLFMHYYLSCIKPAQALKASEIADEPGKAVLANYRQFLQTVLTILQRRNAKDRRCNLFTTNYDGCFAFAADDLLREGTIEFILNDGTRGFHSKVLQASHFNSYVLKTGVFDRHQTSIPQLNLIHLHGSVYWKKLARGIEVDYNLGPNSSVLPDAVAAKLNDFSERLKDEAADLAALTAPALLPQEREDFWKAYKEIPIVNPTKWKFYETVYEEHYYQMLRYLSYELEKPNAVLITFGFSFADEHILNLVKRSLSNPHLKVFICCYSSETNELLKTQFGRYENVELISLGGDEKLNFEAFNEQVLTLSTKVAPNSVAIENPA